MKIIDEKTILDAWDSWKDIIHEQARRNNHGTYSVYVCEGINYGGCQEFKSKEIVFRTKEDAWNYFSKDLGPIGITGEDFWAGLEWDDDAVFSFHYDELGETTVWIEKWDNFDDYVQLAWSYKGVDYKSRNELDRDNPMFRGCIHFDDEPWIRPSDYTEGDDVAELKVTLSSGFETDCKIAEQKMVRDELPVKDTKGGLPF